jgi:hypothetical protein
MSKTGYVEIASRLVTFARSCFLICLSPNFLLVSTSLGASKINGINIMLELKFFQGKLKKIKKLNN